MPNSVGVFCRKSGSHQELLTPSAVAGGDPGGRAFALAVYGVAEGDAKSGWAYVVVGYLRGKAVTIGDRVHGFDSASLALAGPDSAGAFAPRMKVFLEPMNGFEKLLADAIHDKKVPVVLVKERAEADFVMSGEARVKSPNILTGMILTKRGGASIAMKDARTDNLVFACNFHRVDDGERPGDIYIGWAGQCAGHLKKAMKEEEKRKASSLPH